MTDPHELRALVNDFTADIAQAAPINTHQWGAWLVYALQGLELAAMATDPDHPEWFEFELQRLQDVITDRLNLGKWPEQRKDERV